ncbi:MAG: dihydroorotate dehydrogenase electron transfer subunit [Bacteroidales bacterium]|nr:dihydroorotate dehydrogenase electron transfer subunit [Bacteroidales bacterium]
MTTKKQIQDFIVLNNKKINSDYFELELKAPVKLPEIFPAQFIEIHIENAKDTFLRRPISIHDIDYDKNTITLLIQIKGEGTKTLSKIEKDASLNIIYPLGNSFSIPDKKEKVLLVGGGCGSAPLLFLAKYLFNKNIIPYILIGGKSENDILKIENFGEYGNVFITTEDGSLGFKGIVTEHPLLKKEVEKHNISKIYTCGPEPMMKAIAKIANKNNIACEASLENMMACGIGACLCCVVETTSGNQRVCCDGPVFDVKNLKGWE